ncbi:MAG: hypothetical protein ACT4PO_05895 [Actinomycetota bacterium]
MNGAHVQPVLAVFVPGLMGAGILVSGAILLADGARKLMPNLGLRRRMSVARAVHGVVEGVARTAGYEVPEHYLLPREPRSRRAYLGIGLVLTALAALALRAGVLAYTRHGGTLESNPWAIVLGAVVGAPLLLGAALMFALLVLHRRAPRPILRLIASTPLGRLTLPPDDPRERARALHPWLEGKEFR